MMFRRFVFSRHLTPFLMLFLFLSGCFPSPDFPMRPQPPTAVVEQEFEMLDEFGCFPVGCDLPPGMRELCEDYQAGTIAWPADCDDMPGESCQQLCASDKVAIGAELPMAVVDGFQLGWSEPLQLDDNLGDILREDFAWAFNQPVVDRAGQVLLAYTALDEGKPSFFRFWDGEGLTEPKPWQGPQAVQSRVYDNHNLLHIVSMEKMGEPDQHLSHSIWDGKVFIKREAILKGQLVQPAISSDSLILDGQDHLHLVFCDKSQGVMDVWYLQFDKDGWSDPVNLSHSVMNSWGPGIDVSDDGRIFVGWHEDTPDRPVETTAHHYLFTYYEDAEWQTPTPGGFGAIRVDSKGIVHSLGENLYTSWDGKAWADPVMIDYPGQATAMYHYIIDPQDNITFVWNRYNILDQPAPNGYGMTRELMSRVKYADGTWSPVISLGVWDQTPSFNEVHTLLAVDQFGVIHAATSGNFEGGLRQYYLHTGASIADESLARLDVMPPQLAWSPYPSTAPVPDQDEFDQGWQEIQFMDLSSASQLQLDLQVDQSGTLHALWRGQVGSDFEIFYASNNGTGWLDPVNISNSPGYDYDPKLALRNSGALVAGWIGAVPGTTAAFTAEYDGTVWGDPLRVSEKITWHMTSALVELTISQENVIRPMIVTGPEAQIAMGWEHISEGVSNTIAYVLGIDRQWNREQIPIEETHFPYAGERVAMDFDAEGNLHLLFTYSGTMDGFDEGIYLKGQLIHTVYDGSTWSVPVSLLPIAAEMNPYSTMAFQGAIAAVERDQIYVVFSMRPFDRRYWPYRSDNEDSNAYIVVWDGRDWSAPRRLDDGSAFGPCFVDIAKSPTGDIFVTWSKYDTYSNHYSVYMTTFDGSVQAQVVKVWESAREQDLFPILRPMISVSAHDAVVIAFEHKEIDKWMAVYLLKR